MKIAHIHVWDKKNKGDFAIVRAVQQLLKNKFPKTEIVDFPIEVLKKISNQDLVKMNKCDLVVIGGGGIYYHWFMPYDITSIKKIKPPIVIFGVGYIREIGSRKLSKEEQRSIADLNKFAKLISVRDYYTKTFLIKSGVPANKINIIGDPAIFLSEKKPTNITFSKKIKIGININYSGWLGFGKYEKEILKSYDDVIDYFKKNHQAEIYYLLHHPDERKILKKLKNKNIKIIDLSPEKQKYFYGKLDLVIGMMLHSVVLAFGATTPEINIGYDIRNKNFAKFINCPELIITSEKLSSKKLLAKSINVFTNRDKYRKKFLSRKKYIWKMHSDFLNKINDLIK